MPGPLDGIIIIDLTSVVAGPLATQLFAQQGARVLKIEPPEGDRARLLGTIAAPGFSAVHMTLNAGKEAVGLDLAQVEARDILLQLLAQADVLIHNFRPGVADRLGLGAVAMRQQFPRLIIAQISGYGQNGPLSAERAYDPIIQAEAGMTVRDEAGEPKLAPHYICDKIAGLYAAQAVTAALVARERTGQGSVVDVSMLEAAVAFSWIDVHAAETFARTLRPQPSISGVYRPWRTRDGWIVIVMLSQDEFAGWAKVIDTPEVLGDERFQDMPARFLNWDALRQIGGPKLAELSTKEATAQLRAAGVPCGVANDSNGVRAHEQLNADGFLVTRADQQLGATTTPLPVARFNGERDKCVSPAGAIGQHTRQALTRSGIAKDRIEQALASGAARSG